jgi:uncharacterized protein
VTKRVVTSTAVEIAGPSGRLEALLDSTGEATEAVAVICHPHPLHQGTMQNKVVTTLARAFAHLGAAAVRFNFRGVGTSAGTYGDGVGERDDAAAVVAWARGRWPGLPVYLGGFSFGAAVAIALAARVEPRGLITVAPPVHWFPTDFVAPACPWLLVHGSNDDVVPAAPVLEWCNALAVPPQIQLVDGVGHYFHGRLGVIETAVAAFFGRDFGAAGR